MTTVHSIDAIDLKERVAINEAFAPAERDFLLAAISAKLCDGPPRVVIVEAPRNYLGRIDAIWIVLSVDEGGEGVVAAPIGPGGMPLPLIAADKQRLDAIVPLARALAVRLHKVVRLAKFTVREDFQVFETMMAMTNEQFAELNRLVGRRAKAARIAQGLTVEEMAGALGMRILDYQDCEDGVHSFRSRVVPALCLALRIAPNQLFGIEP